MTKHRDILVFIRVVMILHVGLDEKLSLSRLNVKSDGETGKRRRAWEPFSSVETHWWILSSPSVHPIESFSSSGRTRLNDVLQAVCVCHLAVLTRNTSVCPCSNTLVELKDVAFEDEQKYTLQVQVAHDKIQKNAPSSLFFSRPSIRSSRTWRLRNVRHRRWFHSSSSIVHEHDNEAFFQLKLDLTNCTVLWRFLIYRNHRTDEEKRVQRIDDWPASYFHFTRVTIQKSPIWSLPVKYVEFEEIAELRQKVTCRMRSVHVSSVHRSHRLTKQILIIFFLTRTKDDLIRFIGGIE